MGPGSENCTPAAGMGGVGVIVGVRVTRREGVLVGPIVFVALGVGLAVADGLNASAVADGLPAEVVGLFAVMLGSASAVGVVDARGSSVSAASGVDVGSPTWLIGGLVRVAGFIT